jgi:broad specificity phosphatase PhoE
MLRLIRHGEAVGNAEKRLLGRIDSPLTERGVRQGEGLRSLFGPKVKVARVITSPLERARLTAEALSLDAPIDVDDRWVEVDYGRYDGELLSEVPARVWQSWRADPAYRPEGGETLVELGVRVRSACEELFSTDGQGARADGDVVVVSHVSPIKAAVGWALGTGDSVAWRLWLATASLTEIGWGTDTPVLHRYNVVSAQDESDPA